MDGEILRRFQKKSGMTQQEIAEKTGVSQSAVGQWFKTSNVPSETIERFCRALNIKINDLYEGTDLAVISNPVIVSNSVTTEENIRLKVRVEILEQQVERLHKTIENISLNKETEPMKRGVV